MDNKYNLDQDTLVYCQHKENNQREPKEIRESFKDLYQSELEKFKHKVFKFEMPTQVNNGEPIDCLFYYPSDEDYDNSNRDNNKQLSIILYIHGGGFVVDGLKRLPSLLSKLTNSVVVYPMYSLAPESRYPISLEQCYNVLLDLSSNKYKFNNLNTNSISIYGESAGGSLSTGVIFLLKERANQHKIQLQSSVVVYSILNDDFESASYNLFSEGFYLTKASMKYCFGYYLSNPEQVNDITCCPLKATNDQLLNLPVNKTLIISAECDVLREENEQFALKLSQTNNKVQCLRVNSVIHGFLSFDNLIDSSQSQLALKVISNFITNNENNNLINDSINNKLLTKIV